MYGTDDAEESARPVH